MAVDEDKLNAFLGQFVQDLGATVEAAMVVLGHRLGLYRAMAGAGPLSPAEPAAGDRVEGRRGPHPRAGRRRRLRPLPPRRRDPFNLVDEARP